jgi:LysR family glycine cleavage system transcriptional activator
LPLPLLPPLNALRAFKVASLTGSFSLAADELCVSQGAVSRHIAKLEAYLGVKLFDRTSREARLTEAGSQYAAQLQLAFEAIERATLDLHREKKRDRLKIGLFPSLASTWVMQMIQEYQLLHPELGLDILCQTMFSDVDTHALDIMSMNTNMVYDNSDYLPLMDVVLTPICTKDLAAKLGPTPDPADIGAVTTLHSLRRPEYWATWLKAAGVPAARCRLTRHFENSALAEQAANAGMGLAMSMTSIENHLPAFHDLVQPYDLKVRLDETNGFAWRPRIMRSKAARDFIEWFAGQKEQRDLTMAANRTTPPPVLTPMAKVGVAA